MEKKKVLYSGVDTMDVTDKMEKAEEEMKAKGWRILREDMLSSATVRVTYGRGEPDEEDEGYDEDEA